MFEWANSWRIWNFSASFVYFYTLTQPPLSDYNLNGSHSVRSRWFKFVFWINGLRLMFYPAVSCKAPPVFLLKSPWIKTLSPKTSGFLSSLWDLVNKKEINALVYTISLLHLNAESVCKGRISVNEAVWFPFVVQVELANYAWVGFGCMRANSPRGDQNRQKAWAEMWSRNPNWFFICLFFFLNLA